MLLTSKNVDVPVYRKSLDELFLDFSYLNQEDENLPLQFQCWATESIDEGWYWIQKLPGQNLCAVKIRRIQLPEGKRWVPNEKEKQQSILRRSSAAIWIDDQILRDCWEVESGSTVQLISIGTDLFRAPILNRVDMHVDISEEMVPVCVLREMLRKTIVMNGQSIMCPVQSGEFIVNTINTSHPYGFIQHSTEINIQKSKIREKNDDFEYDHDYIYNCFGEPAVRLEQILVQPTPSLISLTGKSGTGKKFLVNALCAKNGLTVIHVQTTLMKTISDTWLTSSEEQFRMIEFHSALESSVFLIELPMASKSTDMWKFSLMHFIDRLSKKAIIVLVGLDVDRLDTWIRHKVDFSLYILTPNRHQRLKILETHHRSSVLDSDELKSIALHTEGYFAADLKFLLNSIIIYASKSKSKEASESRLPLKKFLLQSAVHRQHASLFFNSGQLNVKWQDVHGLDAVKNRLQQIIGDRLKQPGNSPPRSHNNGILLYGPPGTGKTSLAKAIANEYSINFIPISIPQIIKAEMGDSEKSIASIFKLARESQPCILFLDEIDALFGGSRSQNGSNASNHKRLITQLLLEMDQLNWALFDSSKNSSYGIVTLPNLSTSGGVIILGATNIPWVLDKSILRPGRLESHLYIGPPDDETRKQMLLKWIQRTGIHGEHLEMEHSKSPLSSDYSTFCEYFVATTRGFSAADVCNIFRIAGMSALRRSIAQPHVSIHDVQLAFQQIRPSLTDDLMEMYRTFSSRHDSLNQ